MKFPRGKDFKGQDHIVYITNSMVVSVNEDLSIQSDISDPGVRKVLFGFEISTALKLEAECILQRMVKDQYPISVWRSMDRAQQICFADNFNTLVPYACLAVDYTISVVPARAMFVLSDGDRWWATEPTDFRSLYRSIPKVSDGMKISRACFTLGRRDQTAIKTVIRSITQGAST
jgi:hypothetical protein